MTCSQTCHGILLSMGHRHMSMKPYADKISAATCEAMVKSEVKKKHLDAMFARYANGGRGSFFGRHHKESSKQLISEHEGRKVAISTTKREWWSDGRAGKTVEEIFGKETGQRMRQMKSERMEGEKNPAYGKVYENTGCKSTKVGRYKGKLFRGIWEYSYYKHLEERGVDLIQVDYEPFAIPYMLRKKKRTYTPDFLVHSLNHLVEVKTEYTLNVRKRGQKMLEAKREAAIQYCKENGLIYVILTEKDFKIRSYTSAYADPDVEWIRR